MVVSAENIITKRQVAIKKNKNVFAVLDDDGNEVEKASHKTTQLRVAREMMMLLHLKHENVI